MNKVSKVLKTFLGIIVLAFGLLTLVDFIVNGYNPEDDNLLKFSIEFRSLHDAIMQSYLALIIRGVMIISGAAMLTKKYWYIGLLIYLPIAVNILAMHLFYDIPPAHALFFIIGLLVSIPALLLFWIERKRLQELVG